MGRLVFPREGGGLSWFALFVGKVLNVCLVVGRYEFSVSCSVFAG